LAVGDTDDGALQVIDPAVPAAGEPARTSRALLHDPGTPVLADVMEAGDTTVAAPAHHDRLAVPLPRNEVPRIGDLGRAADDLPAQLVAREGVAALTFRRVAEAAGSSTAIVSTYFADKRDLLLSTLRAAASRTTMRFEAAIAEGGDLQAGLEAWLPLDDQRLTDWRVIIAFWGVAVSDPELAEVQDGHVTRARARVEKLLR